MPDMKDLQDAFMRAHEAGDTARAKVLADGIEAERARSLAVSKAASDKIDASVKALPLQDMSGGEQNAAAILAGGTDKVIGTARAINEAIGWKGGADTLKAKEAERENLNKSLYGTTPGAAGQITGSLIPDVIGGSKLAGAVTKAGPLLGKWAPQWAQKGATALTGDAVVGGAIGATSPGGGDKSLTERGLEGARDAAVGGTALRSFFRGLKPIQEVLSDTTSQQLQTLRPHLDKMIAENLTDKKWVRSMTNALGQMPFFQGPVDRARSAVERQATGHVTQGTPFPTDELSPSARKSMEKIKGAGYTELRNDPAQVPIVGSDNLRDQLTKTVEQVELSGGRTGEASAEALRKSIEKAGGSVPNVAGAYTPVGEVTIPASKKMIDAGKTNIAKSGLTTTPIDIPSALNINPVTNVATVTPPRTAKKLIDAGKEVEGPFSKLAKVHVPERTIPLAQTGPVKELPTTSVEAAMGAHKALSATLHGAAEADKPAIRAQMRALKEGLEAGLGPEKYAAYLELQKQHGLMSDILETTGKGAKFADMQGLANKMLKDGRVAQSPLEDFVAAASERIKLPPGTENRALVTNLLLGTAGGIGGAKIADDPLQGAVVGAAGIPLLANLLLATPGGGRYLTGQNKSAFGKLLQSDETKKMLEMLGRTGGAEAGPDVFKKKDKRHAP